MTKVFEKQLNSEFQSLIANLKSMGPDDLYRQVKINFRKKIFTNQIKVYNAQKLPITSNVKIRTNLIACRCRITVTQSLVETIFKCLMNFIFKVYKCHELNLKNGLCYRKSAYKLQI